MVAAGNGHKFWSHVCSTKTASVAAWLQPAEQSVLQVGSKENPRKGPKNLFVHVANTQKCVHLCCVSSKSFPPSWGVSEAVGFFSVPFLMRLHSA